jgi:limonene 1,2-monooxygenase
MPFHLADSREEAIRDIEEGVLAWNNEYYVGTLGAPMREPAKNGREMAENLIAFGAFIGTPDDAITGIQKLLDVSGGFGAVLGLAHDWAPRDKTLRSFELFARYVAPRFQDTLTWTDRSQKWTSDNKEQLMTGAKAAVFKAIADAGKTDDLAKTVAQAAGFIPTQGTRTEGTPPAAPPSGAPEGEKEAVEEGAPGS